MKKPAEPVLKASSGCLMPLSDLDGDDDGRYPFAKVLEEIAGVPADEIFVQISAGYDWCDTSLVRVRVTEKDRERHEAALARYREKLATYEHDQNRRALAERFKAIAAADPAKAQAMLEGNE